MKALVVYESLFGNTEQVARAVAEGLAETLEVETYEVADAPKAVREFLSLIVIGGPTHAFSLSRPSTRAEAHKRGATKGASDFGVREWLEGLPTGPHSESVATFDTRADRARHLPGSAAKKATRMARAHRLHPRHCTGELLRERHGRAPAPGRARPRPRLGPRAGHGRDGPVPRRRQSLVRMSPQGSDSRDGIDRASLNDLVTLARGQSGRLPAVPRLRRRLQRAPLGCGRPVWVDDVHFDLDEHLSTVELSPGRCPRKAAVSTPTTKRCCRSPVVWCARLWTGSHPSGLHDGSPG